MALNKMACMTATYLHEESKVVPQGLAFFDPYAREKFLPDFNSINDPRKRAIAYAEFMDDFVIGCGDGSLKSRTVSSGVDYVIVERETGMRVKQHRLGEGHRASWRPTLVSDRMSIHTLHDWTEILSYPVMRREDLTGLALPDPDDPGRYLGVEENVRYFTERGYMASGSITGFFSGVWYNLCPFNLWLASLIRDHPFAKRLVDKLGDFNCRAAQNLLEKGVQCITWSDDLGYKRGTFIAPRVYEEIIYPWHRRVAQLAHKYEAFVEMHVDGNINAIMDLLVQGGVDAINNVGPGDNMDLATLKAKYGDHITLSGGMSRYTAQMTWEALRAHIIDRISIGSPGGGYILGQEGGITPDMSLENFSYLLACSRKHRRNRP